MIYEVTLEYVGKGEPHYIHTEYGFGMNPPITISAKDIEDVKRQLELPSTVKIRRVQCVSPD